MMLELPNLMEGVVDSLDQVVAPNVKPGQARAALYSCIDLLNNIVAKVEWKRELLDTEIEGVLSVLQNAKPLLETLKGKQESVDSILEGIDAVVGTYAQGGGDREEGRRSCNSVLEDLIVFVAAAENSTDREDTHPVTRVHELIRGHLANQVIRDAFFLKPMMLNKISNG